MTVCHSRSTVDVGISKVTSEKAARRGSGKTGPSSWSAYVKGSRTPAARALPHTRAAGVREASGEETAGRVRSVVVRVMGIVMLAVAARRGGPGELELSEAAADGDRVSRRAAWRRHAYRNERHDCGARWR